MRRSRAPWAVCGFVLLGAVASSCTSGSADPLEGDGRTAAVYQSILDWMVDEEPQATIDERPDWVMFVAARSEEQIDLDVQVAVVDAFHPTIFVRFVDERAEAVDEDGDDEAVRDEGVLVGLGAVGQKGDTVEVYVDRYRNANDVEAWLVAVHRARDSWELVGPPVPTEVRPRPTDT